MSGAYRNDDRVDEGSDVFDSLEAYVREGARRMLATALEEEVIAILRRGPYERGKPYRGYRNRHHPARELTVRVGPVEMRVPRVADVPPEVARDGRGRRWAGVRRRDNSGGSRDRPPTGSSDRWLPAPADGARPPCGQPLARCRPRYWYSRRIVSKSSTLALFLPIRPPCLQCVCGHSNRVRHCGWANSNHRSGPNYEIRIKGAHSRFVR
jgi:hypothetical protein